MSDDGFSRFLLIGNLFNQDTEKIKTVVIERVDDFIGNGFEEQWLDILQMLSMSIQIIMCSAAMPLCVLHLARRCMKNPLEIHFQHPNLTLDAARQFYINVHSTVQCFLSSLVTNSMADGHIHLLGTENGHSIKSIWRVG